METDQQILMKAITAGDIPLVSCYRLPNGSIEFRTVKGNLTSNYTVVSHVWSGGLGNFQRNVIPLC